MTHYIFDCDDVLLDWKGGFYTWLRTVGFTPDPTGPHHWDLWRWLNTTPAYARKLVTDFNASKHFGNLKALPNARSTVWTLNARGDTCSVLSICGNEGSIRQARQHNLTMEFAKPVMGGYDFAFTATMLLPLGAAKFEVLYRESKRFPDTILVEDSFQHAQAGAVNGMRSYCIRKAHNRADEASNPTSSVIWIDDISEVL